MIGGDGPTGVEEQQREQPALLVAAQLERRPVDVDLEWAKDTEPALGPGDRGLRRRRELALSPRHAEWHSSGSERRERPADTLDAELVNPLRLLDSLQTVLAEVTNGHALELVLVDERARRS